MLRETPRRRLRLTHIAHIPNGTRIRQRVDSNAARAAAGVIVELREDMATHMLCDPRFASRARFPSRLCSPSASPLTGQLPRDDRHPETTTSIRDTPGAGR